MIIPATTAAMAGNPRPTSKGTATAAGVPNPADPSINEPNNHAIMIACILRSGEMEVKPSRIDRIAPLSCRVFKRRMAPKMMYSKVNATISPLTVAAATCRALIFQTAKASPAAVIYESGIARLAGHRRMTKNTITTKIGKNESKASRPVPMIWIFL